MSGVMEFGFDDSKVVKTQSLEEFKQNRSGQKDRIAIVAFKRYHDGVFAKKAREKGSALTDDEKAELIKTVDNRIAEQAKKSVADLTELDRLDIKAPKFWVAFTHYNESVGTIRCLGKYEGSTCTKPDICCDKFGDAEQKIATIIMQYPVDNDGQIDVDDLLRRKHTHFFLWRFSAKNYKRIESAYIEARNEQKFVVDLMVQLDGDPKFKKQIVTAGAVPVWARETYTDAKGEKVAFDPAVRAWILNSGLTNQKHVQGMLGFELKRDQLLERLGGKAQSEAALSGGEASAEQPRLVGGYDDLLG